MKIMRWMLVTCLPSLALSGFIIINLRCNHHNENVEAKERQIIRTIVETSFRTFFYS